MPSHHGRQTLPTRTRKRLYKLVDDGLSYTKTATRVRCHRNTVYLHVRKRRLAADAGEQISTDDSADRTRRCPGCGGLVDMPCVLCTARDAANLPPTDGEPVLKTKKKKAKPRPSMERAFVVLADRTGKMPARPSYGYLALDKKMRPILVKDPLKAARFGTRKDAESFAIEAGVPYMNRRVVVG